jgi:methylenetetrahydrofolate reductase (NADPH)
MAANVYDLDSIQFIQMVKNMRDEGRFFGGDAILNPPKMFIGAAANPFADPFELRVARLAKKVKAGADFIQTQCIYNLDKFEKWMEGVRDRGLDERVSILAGVTPLKSAGMAKYMKNKVPGMDVPDEVIKRMSGVPKEKQAEEGIKICVEQIQELRRTARYVVHDHVGHQVGLARERGDVVPRAQPRVDAGVIDRIESRIGAVDAFEERQEMNAAE